MTLSLKTTGIAANVVAALVNDAGTIKLFRYGTSTLTVGGGLTVAGTITAESSPTTYNGHSVYEMTVAAESRLTIDSAIAGWDWAQANGVAAFAAFTALTADATDAGIIAESDNANPNDFLWYSHSSGQFSIGCYNYSNNIYSTPTLPTDGTDFSCGMRFKNSDSTGDVALWYGVAGSAGAFTNSTNTGGWTASDNGLKYLFNNAGSTRDLAGKCILFVAFNTKSISNSDFEALHSDPIGTLFDVSGGSAALTVTARLGLWRRQPTRMVSGAWRYVRTLADAAANLAPNVFNVDIAETASASDSLSSAATLAASVSEAASAADTCSSIATLAAAIAETISAADQVSAGAASYDVAIAETATAVDAISALLHAAVTLTETGSASDAISSVATLAASLAESVSASDIVSTGGATYSVDVAEAASAVESLSAAWQAAVSLSEAGSATDSVAAQVAFAQALAEAVTALDVLTAAGILGVTITETGNATDSVSAPTGFGETPASRTITVQRGGRTITVQLHGRTITVH